MEILTAIALMCQINVGIGNGAKMYKNDMHKLFDRIELKQRTCQQKLAKCILKGPLSQITTALRCIKDR